MAVILVLWMLGLIVIAIAWGGVDKLAVPIKTAVRSLLTLKLSKRSEFIGGTFLAVTVLSIMAIAADHRSVNHMGEGGGLPTLVIWTGGLWLIPFQFDHVGHYWLASLAVAFTLALFWVWGTTSPSTRTQTPINVSAQPGQDTSAGETSLGFLLLIVLIGLTVTAIARYTSTGNAVALNS
jgi:hypothetical protein